MATKTRQEVDRINEKLAASSMAIELVPVGQCDLVDKNARFMRTEQYNRLVENVRKDGCLTSVPLASKREGRYLILSGNHRVQAARDAELAEIVLLVVDREMSRDEEVAVQLSHNAIVGQDDMAILRELYDEINDVVLKEYSGIDDVLLGRAVPPELDPLSEKGLEYKVVSISFLPDEVDRMEGAFKAMLEKAEGEKTWVNRHAEYDRMLDDLTVVREKAGVKNTATALMMLLDIAERHMDEIPEKPEKKSKSSKKKGT